MADRYWVGNGGNWSDNTNHWSASSGGAPGASKPTASDNAIFNASSFSSGSQTVTLDETANVLSMNWTGATNSPTFNVSGRTINCGGSFTLISGMTYTTNATTAYVFNATSGTSVITTAGKLLAKLITFNGAGGTFQNADNCNTNNGTITLTAGTWDINGKTIDCNQFQSSGAATRTLTMGSGTIQSVGTWNVSSSMTLTANTGTIICNAGSASFTSGGVSNYNKITFSGSGSATCQDAFTCVTLTRTGTAVKTDALIITGNITCSTSFVCNGNSLTNRVWVRSNGLGVARTVTSALFTITNSDFQDFTAAGTGAPLTGTSVGDMGGTTSVTKTTAVTRYWVATSGGSWSATSSWSTSSGGASGASVPLCHDTVVIDANSITSGSRTITVDMPRCGQDITCTGVLNSPAMTISGSDTTSIGNVTLATGMTTTATLNWNFFNRSAATFTTAGVTIAWVIIVNCPGTTLTAGDNITQANVAGTSFNLQNGTFEANGKNITTRGINVSVSTAGITRTLNLSTGTWTVTGTGVVAISSATNLTVNCSTSTIKATNTGACTFQGAGFTFYKLWYSAGAGTGSFTFLDGNTFDEIKDDGSAAHSIFFTAGTTTTFRLFTVSGSAGNVITINSAASSTSTHALVKTGGGIVSCDYLNIQHSVASPGTFYAGTHSTDNQGVSTAGSGWLFQAPPLPGKLNAVRQAVNRASTF